MNKKYKIDVHFISGKTETYYVDEFSYMPDKWKYIKQGDVSTALNMRNVECVVSEIDEE